MLKRIVFGVLLAGVATGLFFLRELSPYVFDGAIAVVMFLSLYEMIRLFKEHMSVPAIVVIAVYAVSLYPAYKFLGGMQGVLISSLVFFVILNVVAMFDPKASMQTVFCFLFLTFYPTLLISTAYYVNDHSQGLVLLLLTIVVSVLSDTMAYFTGVTVKGKKLCPSISPKKTISGAIGGLVGGIGGGFAIYGIFHNLFAFNLILPDIWICAILGLIGSILTQLGDLVASNLKRKFNVKDFGTLIPGHGGLIDRMDGMMFNLLGIYLFAQFFLA